MIDPVTLAVLKGRLEQIVDEMDATLFRSAFNPIIAEAHEAFARSLRRIEWRHAGAGKVRPAHFVGIMAFAIRAVIDRVTRDGGLADGDVYIFNDPYDGGSHLSDFRLVKPPYRDGVVFCYFGWPLA